jgi:hypothetical protein
MGIHYTFNGLFDAAVPVIRENGHYDTLEREVMSIQSTFQEIKDVFGVSEDERSNIVGHYGLGGEFGNGIGPAIKNYIKQLEPAIVKNDQGILTEHADLMHKAFNHFAASYYEKPSQRAKYAAENHDEQAADEKAGPALQRSLDNMREWTEQARARCNDLAPEMREFVTTRLDKISKSVEISSRSLEQIEKLAQTASISAVAHNFSVRSLEREEMRALFQLNRTIGQKLHS